MNKKNNFKKHIIFWLSQSVSQIGSSMTGFTLSIWAYSFMTFFNYVPYIIMSLFAGVIVERYKKRNIMLIADSTAAVCSLMVFIFWSMGELSIYHIYLVNCVIGFANAFQNPTSAVVIGKLLPKEEMGRTSGLSSFSSNLAGVFAPILAATVYSTGGLTRILGIDFGTFFVCLFGVTFPDQNSREKAGNQEIRLFL